MKRTSVCVVIRAVVNASLVGLVVGCVEHRPIRNGLRDESIYMEKSELTQDNPKDIQRSDSGWLFKVAVAQASSPNVLGDFVFPGLESTTRYVRFRFKENAMQVVDARSLQQDDLDDPNDDLATRTDLVLMEFAGENVDIKLRENLDGERTNLLEENTEEPWQERQHFKVDLERTSVDPVTAIAWFYGDYIADCAAPVGAHLVPNSYSYDAEDQAINFRIEATYKLNVATQFGACYDMLSLTHDVGGATIVYHLSFYRPGASAYAAEVIGEKDAVNKKYGAFQVLNLFRDETTGILSAKSLLQRWDPQREDPVTFYFAPGFPPEFKDMFATIREETNQVFADVGAKLRVDFVDYNADGIERQFGDLRYSFVTWNQDIDTTRGLLGYGPSSSDPRTGEVISANVNLYNVGLDYYRYLIQTYLEEKAGAQVNVDDVSGLARPWEDIECTVGDTVIGSDGSEADFSHRLDSALFDEMRFVMDIDRFATGDERDFIPEPKRGANFFRDYHRILGELRYVEPANNDYVASPSLSTRLDHFADRKMTERAFQEKMVAVALNEDPFGGIPLHTREGMQAQGELLQQLRTWRKNHDALMRDEEFLFGSKNIFQFDANDAISAIAGSARRCVASGSGDVGRWESDDAYTQRIINDVVFQVAIHEFGHNLGLRHNFYGSVDAQHMEKGQLSASVMDYVASWEEAASLRAWGQYDQAALGWIYGTQEVRDAVMTEDFLFCTDQHRSRSPLCTAHDLGITPSQIALNAIERYDWLYKLRNLRAYRTFWDTSGYASNVYGSLFPLLRLWYLGIYDWGGGGVQDTLKRLDQIDNERTVLSTQEYDAIAEDFYNDIGSAISMIMAFYDAINNQSASFRNYQTEFDPYYGDILRMGIIVDKLYATIAFMDLQEVYNYNPNIQDYVSLYDAPLTSQNASIAQRVLDNMLGSNYDTFPWFRYYALFIFGDVTNTNLVGNVQLKERIAIKRFETAESFLEMYGQDVLEEVERADNPSRIFVFDGEQYVYTYLPDRNWHLVAGASRNPVSYQFMREYNEDLNASASTSLDNYGLKILLAYYEYFNNFSGF